MTRETLDKLRAMGMTFGPEYDLLANTLEASRKADADNARITKIEYKPATKKSVGFQYFEVKVTLSANNYLGSVSVVVDGINYTATKQGTTFMQNSFFATVQVDVSTPEKQKQNFKIAVFLKDLLGIITDTRSKDLIVDRSGFVEDKIKFEKCFCNRDFTVEELKKIITELRNNTFYAGKNILYYHKDYLFYKEEKIPNDQKTYEKFTQILNDTLKKFEVNTCLRKIHFLSQVYSETGYLTRTKETGENLKYDPYRGRGFIQLTATITKSGNWVAGVEDSRTHNKTSYLGYEDYSGHKVVNNPDIISESIYISADSAGWFWKCGKLLEDGSILDLNLEADKDNILRISKLINGGKEALKQRTEAYNALKTIFDYENCKNK